MNDTVQLDPDLVNGMADDCEVAAETMGGSAELLSGDATAAAGGLAGFTTAAELTATQAAWDRKALACRDSLDGFSASLRETAAGLSTQDGANAADVEQAGAAAEGAAG